LVKFLLPKKNDNLNFFNSPLFFVLKPLFSLEIPEHSGYTDYYNSQ